MKSNTSISNNIAVRQDRGKPAEKSMIARKLRHGTAKFTPAHSGRSVD